MNIAITLPKWLGEDMARTEANVRSFVAEDYPKASLEIGWHDDPMGNANIRVMRNGVPTDDTDEIYSGLSDLVQSAVES